MKRVSAILSALLLCVAASGCGIAGMPGIPGEIGIVSPQSSPSAPLTPRRSTASENSGRAAPDALIRSYYGAGDAPAFRLIQSGMLGRLVSHWTAASVGGELDNPTWQYDTFTRYQILDYSLTPVAGGDELYCCTFQTENGRFGYFVLRYEHSGDGGGLGNMGGFETSYPYDLQTHLADVLEKLRRTDLDLESATAERVRLVDGDIRSTEAILFADGNRRYLYNLHSLELDEF